MAGPDILTGEVGLTLRLRIPWDPTGLTVRIKMIRPDGEAFYWTPDNVDAPNKIVEYTIQKGDVPDGSGQRAWKGVVEGILGDGSTLFRKTKFRLHVEPAE